MTDVENPPENPSHVADASSRAGGAPLPTNSASAGVGTARRNLKVAVVIGVFVAAVGLTIGLVLGLGGNGKVTSHNVSQSNNIGASSNVPGGDGEAPEPSGATQGAQENSSEDTPSEDFEEDPVSSLIMETDFTEFHVSEGPVAAQVKGFSPSLVDGYETCSDLENDIVEALKFYASQLILEQSVEAELYASCDESNPNWMSEFYGYDYSYYYHYGATFSYDDDDDDDFSVFENSSIVTPEMSKRSQGLIPKKRSGPVSSEQSSSNAASNTRSGDVTKEDSFYSNNQVHGVDDADIVKSNGEFVFAGYGDVLYTWNASDGNAGLSITNIPGESNDCTDSFWYYYGYDSEPCVYLSKPRVLSLLLNGDRLTAIIGQDTYSETTVYDYSVLSIRVFDISSIVLDESPLTEVFSKNISGSFYSGRSVGEDFNIIVSTSYLQTYNLFDDLYRYNSEYCGLNATEYITLANSTLSGKDFSSFAKQVVKGLSLDGDCSRVFQVSTMSSTVDKGNVLNQFVHITSLNVTSFETSSSGTFIPEGYLSTIYATEDIIATASSDHSGTTYVQTFDLKNASAVVPRYIGKVNGTMVNKYAVDFFEDHLRIATTVSNWTDWNQPVHSNKIYVLSLPDDGGAVMEVVGETEQLGKDIETIHGVRFFGPEAYVVTFENIDPFITVDLSDPENPVVEGELEVPGLSTYLERIEIDGDPFILAIGHVWNDTRIESDMKLTLFDISNMALPQAVAEYAGEGISTDAEYYFYSVRYLPESQKLIIPVQDYTSSGFAVFDISSDGISLSFDASLTEAYGGCWYDAQLPPRTLVFESKMTAITGKSAISYDMETHEKLFELDLDKGLNYSHCDYSYDYYGYGYHYGYDIMEYDYGDEEEFTWLDWEVMEDP